MALKFFWRCEGTTLDGTHDYSAGDTTATLTNAATNTDAAYIGTNGLDVPTNADYAQFDISSGDLLNSSEGAIGFWLRMVSFFSANSLIIAYDASNQSRVSVEMTGTDDATGREILLRNREFGVNNFVLFTTDADLQLNTWYFVVARWNVAASDRKVEVYDTGLSLIGSAEDLTTAFTAAPSLTNLNIGERLAAGPSDFHIDNVMIADSYSEPLQTYANYTSYTQTQAAAITDVNLLSLTNVPRASLTSLKWSWFDSVLPGSYSAPVVQGTTESTDGSGNISLTLTGSVLTSGQEGTLVLSNSAGTLIGAYRLAVD